LHKGCHLFTVRAILMHSGLHHAIRGALIGQSRVNFSLRFFAWTGPA
jgi:hypothetical protein